MTRPTIAMIVRDDVDDEGQGNDDHCACASDGCDGDWDEEDGERDRAPWRY